MALAKRIIPCLDVDNGRVVKGVNFVDLIDAGDPVEQARFYDEAGADELVFLDISASEENRKTMRDVVSRTADVLFIPLTVGGGIGSVDDMRSMLDAGADKISINSSAIAHPELITEGSDAFGSQCIVVDLIDAGDPVEQARFYDEAGADELVFLDISASEENRKTMRDVVSRTADVLFIPLTVGGGIGSVDDMRSMLDAGADKISINSSAIAHPELITEGSDAFGSQCIVVAIDARREEDGSWQVYTHAGRRPSGLDAIEWAKEAERRGAGELLVTSMDRDGTRDGYDLTLLKKVSEAVGIPVIASGGAGTLEHLAEGLTKGGCDAVLAASIFHFREFSIADAKEYLRGQGIPVRPIESAEDNPSELR